jgi:hypothetical protein
VPIDPALPRARFLRWALLLFILTSGCAAAGTGSREWVRPVYREKIREWQMRIQREGWSESQVHAVLSQFRTLAAYRMEIIDHWDTPKEFAEKGYSGDCEDIAVFMMATLKRLGYPHGIRILIVQGLFEDHALLRVEMAEGGWKVYDVVPRGVPSPEESLLKPIVEFDEKGVDWFPSQAGTSSDAGKGNGAKASDPGRIRVSAETGQ